MWRCTLPPDCAQRQEIKKLCHGALVHNDGRSCSARDSTIISGTALGRDTGFDDTAHRRQGSSADGVGHAAHWRCVHQHFCVRHHHHFFSWHVNRLLAYSRLVTASQLTHLRRRRRLAKSCARLWRHTLPGWTTTSRRQRSHHAARASCSSTFPRAMRWRR